MTRQKLIERIHRRDRRLNRWGITWVVSVLTMTVAGTFLRRGASRATEEIALVAFVAAFIACVGMMAFLLVLETRKAMQRAGLVCPACHAPLTIGLRQIAVASGRCGKCGKWIVEEGP